MYKIIFKCENIVIDAIAQSCAGMPFKYELNEVAIKYHSQYIYIYITRSSDSFSAVPPIVNAGYWGCIVRDLETIIVLVLRAFNFFPQRSHHKGHFGDCQSHGSGTLLPQL